MDGIQWVVEVCGRRGRTEEPVDRALYRKKVQGQSRLFSRVPGSVLERLNRTGMDTLRRAPLYCGHRADGDEPRIIRHGDVDRCNLF
jgi:hypothetical protein